MRGRRQAGPAGKILTSLGLSETILILEAFCASLPDQYLDILPATLSQNALVPAQEYATSWEMYGVGQQEQPEDSCLLLQPGRRAHAYGQNLPRAMKLLR